MFVAGSAGSVNVTEHRLYVGHLRVGRAFLDLGKEGGIDLDGVHATRRSDGLGQRHFEQPRSRTDVRDLITRMEP